VSDLTVSLCFLSYNRPGFLPNAISTAIKYADQPVEVIVHDDGSSDPTLIDWLHTIHKRGEISTLILNTPGHNEGTGVAMNRLFRMARGDLLVKIDQDVTFHPGWLAKAREIMVDERVGLLGLFKYWHDPVDFRKTLISDVKVVERDLGPVPFGYSFHTHICGSAFVVPRDVYENLGPFAEHYDSYGEDWEFQKAIDSSGGLLMNALPDQDLVTNHGFGIGPSTVVVAGPDGKPEPSKIHHGPRYF
jgi:glycosyltransferase involved in cell wall biosynthesis